MNLKHTMLYLLVCLVFLSSVWIVYGSGDGWDIATNRQGDSIDKSKDLSRPDSSFRKRTRKRKKGRSPESSALEAWADSLTSRDYNYTDWRIRFHSRSTVDFFNNYAKILSNVFKEYDAKVNFVMIGACDGTGDNTIKYLYLPNDHWRGVFVEPMTINVRDLIQYMADKHANHRSYIIHAAATAECEKPTLMVERPLYEEKNKSIPHWLRRQIGSVLPEHRSHARKEWTLEEVRCVSADDVLTEWAGSSAGSQPTADGIALRKGASRERPKKRRPHILKIDVEGHDFQVLMSFLHTHTPASELPLLIDFEAKSIAKKFPAAKERMEQLGYVVSPFGQDGFALLMANKIYESIDSDPRHPRNSIKLVNSRTADPPVNY